LGHLYQQLGISEESFGSARKLHKALQQLKPDFFVGNFIYGYANNYAGTNLSNLDVTLATMQSVAGHCLRAADRGSSCAPFGRVVSHPRHIEISSGRAGDAGSTPARNHLIQNFRPAAC
jgi:hypothetical protein